MKGADAIRSVREAIPAIADRMLPKLKQWFNEWLEKGSRAFVETTQGLGQCRIPEGFDILEGDRIHTHEEIAFLHELTGEKEANYLSDEGWHFLTFRERLQNEIREELPSWSEEELEDGVDSFVQEREFDAPDAVVALMAQRIRLERTSTWGKPTTS